MKYKKSCLISSYHKLNFDDSGKLLKLISSADSNILLQSASIKVILQKKGSPASPFRERKLLCYGVVMFGYVNMETSLLVEIDVDGHSNPKSPPGEK